MISATRIGGRPNTVRAKRVLPTASTTLWVRVRFSIPQSCYANWKPRGALARLLPFLDDPNPVNS